MTKMHNYTFTANLNVFVQIDLHYDAHCSGTPNAITYNFTLPT